MVCLKENWKVFEYVVKRMKGSGFLCMKNARGPFETCLEWKHILKFIVLILYKVIKRRDKLFYKFQQHIIYYTNVNLFLHRHLTEKLYFLLILLILKRSIKIEFYDKIVDFIEFQCKTSLYQRYISDVCTNFNL